MKPPSPFEQRASRSPAGRGRFIAGAIAAVIALGLYPLEASASAISLGSLENALPAQGVVGTEESEAGSSALQQPGELITASGPINHLSTYVRAERGLLERAWGVRVPDLRAIVSRRAEIQQQSAPEADGGRLRVPLTSSDLDGDGREDVLFFDIGLDENSFLSDVHLTALEGSGGEQLWSRDFGTPFDILVFSPGDVTGDGAEDLLVIEVERATERGALPCMPALCAYDDQLNYRWDVALMSGPDGERAWNRSLDGSVRFTGGYAFQGPARQEVLHLEGSNALIDLRPSDDHDGDGLDDFTFNVHDFSGEIVHSQQVSNENLRYATRAEAIAGDTGATLLTRARENQLGAALLLPAGDATGDGRADLLWTVPTRIALPSVCGGSAGCIRGRRAQLQVELVDGVSEETTWEVNLQDAGLVAAAPVLTQADLTGDARADVVLGLGFEDRSQSAVALSGIDGERVWTFDTIITDPPSILPSLDGGKGNDMLFWEGWEPVPDEAPGVIFRIRLRRVDGASGNELFSTQHDLLDEEERLDSIFAYSVGDVDADGATDIGHALWHYSAPWEPDGVASTILRVESGDDGTELARAERDRKSLLFAGGDWVPGGPHGLFEGSVPHNDTNFRLAAIAMPGATTLWSRLDVAFTALFGPLRNTQGGGDDIVYGRTQFVDEAPRWRSRLEILQGTTGDEIWGVGSMLEMPSPEPTPTETMSPTPSESPSTPDIESTTTTFTDRSRSSGQHSDRTFFEARLGDSEGRPVSGAALSFELIGAESSRSFTATTGEDGVASVAPTLEERPGPYQLTVHYTGDDAHGASSDTSTFVVDKEDTDTGFTSEGKGSHRILTARLSDQDTPSVGIAGRTIDFYSDGELIGSGVTDAEGIATVTIPPAHRGANRTYEAVFAGDDLFMGSSDERPGQGGGQGDGGGTTQGAALLL